MASVSRPQTPPPQSLVGVVAAGLVIALIVGTVWSTFYRIDAEEVGVVMRFGKHIDTVTPGLHGKLPLGIDTVRKVPVERQLKQEYGYSTAGATNSTQFSSSTQERDAEKSMVTGDLNAALVEWVVQYHIVDPVQFLFEVRNPEETLRDVSESVMREIVGDRTVDEVITIGRQDIEVEMLGKLQEVVDSYSMGLRVDQVQLQNVNPPQPVQASFDEVNQAQQEMKRDINLANGEYNKAVPRARGEADQKLQEAEGYATKRINEAEGDVSAFRALLEEYRKAPEVTRQRLYLETMADVLAEAGPKVIIDEGSQGLLPLLQLSPGPFTPSPPAR